MEETEHTTDLTKKQYRDNYWKTTVETKLDGSAAMMETRISKCMEATGKSREECSKEVKAEMKKAGSENTNTEDMEEERKEEEEKEVESKTDMEEEKKEKDIIEVKKERLDFLESFYEDNKDSEATFSARLDSLEATIQKYKDKEAKKLEETLEEKIEKFSTDFFVPKEEVLKKLNGRKGKEGIAFIQDMEGFIELTVKKDVKEEDEGKWDSADYLSKVEAQAQKMRTELRHID